MQRRITILGIVLVVSTTANAQVSVWNKLMARAQMEGERVRTRAIALNMACDWADPAGANQIVSLVSSWVDSIEQAGSQPEPMSGAALSARREMICSLVCQSGSRLNAVANPAGTLGLWTDIATASWASQDVKEAAFERIADNTSWFWDQQAAALTALGSSGVGRAGRLPAEFAPFIDDAALPALRAMVSESGFDPTTFNFTAAAALAEQGDAAILPDLQARQDTFNAIEPRYGDALAWYIWQIQVQNPPSQLIAHIASAELYSPESRRWAVRRAIELGLSAEEIRQAILQYSETGHRVGPDQLAAGIASIKAVASDAGVLSADDLADVPILAASQDPSDASTPTCADWDVQTPTVAWQPPWEPRYENYDAFFEWVQTISWESLPEEQATELFRQKLCELELMPPAQCTSATPQSPQTEQP